MSTGGTSHLLFNLIILVQIVVSIGNVMILVIVHILVFWKIFCLRCGVTSVQLFVTHGTVVLKIKPSERLVPRVSGVYLHIQPFPQTDGVEHVSAAGHLGRAHLLITDGAHVVVLFNLLLGRVKQTVDLGHGAPALVEGGPAVPSLAPDVEVGVDQHHDGSDGAATFKEQNPAAVEKEEDRKTEFDRVAKGSDVVHAVIK